MSTKNRAPRTTRTATRTRTSSRTSPKRPREEDVGSRTPQMPGPQIQDSGGSQTQAESAISIIAVEQLLRGYGCPADVRLDESGQVVATAANPRMQAEVDRRLQEVLRMSERQYPRPLERVGADRIPRT